MLKTEGITQIATDRRDLYAFRISGKISDNAMEDMAKSMNAAFDVHDEKIDMLLIFDHFQGSEFGAGWDWDVIKSRVKAISNVNRYIVVGAPSPADSMIGFMDTILPVKAETFDDEEIAWRSLHARAVAA